LLSRGPFSRDDALHPVHDGRITPLAERRRRGERGLRVRFPTGRRAGISAKRS